MLTEVTQIHENDVVKVFIEHYSADLKVICIYDQISGQAFKQWAVYRVNDKWVIKNHQYKSRHVVNNIINIEYEWVTYPIDFDTFEDLLNTFQEITNDYTCLFPFPTE